MNFNIYKKINFILIIALIFLITEALIWGYGWRLSKIYTEIEILKYGNPGEGWNPIIWQENGIVEIIQEILLLITILYLIHIYFFIKKTYVEKLNLYKLFVILKIIGLSYFFLEEISWGQHFINYQTPLIFTEEESILFNHQKEFNLHNTSNLFNEIPRAIVLFWCSLSIIIIKIFRNNIQKHFQNMVNPSDQLLFLSGLILIFSIPDLVLTKFDIIDYSSVHTINDQGIEVYNFSSVIPILFSFNFFRLSELQEFLFIYYFFWHSYFFKQIFYNLKKI